MLPPKEKKASVRLSKKALKRKTREEQEVISYLLPGIFCLRSRYVCA